MTELHHLLPALDANGASSYNGYWWILLAVVVVAIILPAVYLTGHDRGRPLQH